MDDQAGVVWRKSTLSTTNGCVEVAVAVEWEAFVGGVRGGEFDLVFGLEFGLSPGR